MLSHAYELVRPYRHLLILSIVLSVALAGIDLVGPQIIRKILDGPVQHHNIQGIGKLSLLYIGFVILSFVVEAALTLIINWTGQKRNAGHAQPHLPPSAITRRKFLRSQPGGTAFDARDE